MNKVVVLLLLSLRSVLLFGFLNDDEDNLISTSLSSEMSKKYHLSICAIFKNEAKYLKEWIEYHRIFGVDHFFLYNIGSKDYFQIVLQPYIDEGIVTLVHWPEAISHYDDRNAFRWALSTQIPAYENAVNFKAGKETKWLVIIDINEFLVSPKGNIGDLLKEYDDYSGISFYSDCFDAAKNNTFPKKRLLIQSLDLTSPPKQIVDKSVTKIIFKPDRCAGFTWPPYQCRFNETDSLIAVNRQELRINHYINRNKGYSKSRKVRPKLDVDNRLLPEKMTLEFLAEGYLIEDQERPIYQYIPELLKRMGL